jgi:hypothetical protein
MSQSQTLYAHLRKRRGLGFAAPDYFGGGNYGEIGGGGLDFAAPPDFTTPGTWSGNTDIFNWNWDTGSYNTPGLTPDTPIGGDWSWDGSGWYDAATGLYVDQYGGIYDTWGTGWGVYPDDPLTDERLHINTTDLSYMDLQTTLDWWNSLTSPTLPDTSAIDWDRLFQEIYAGTIQLPGGPQYDPVVNPLPPKNSSWWKEQLKKIPRLPIKPGAPGGAPGGAAGGAKPASMPPNAQGKCPTGYALHPQTRQCVLLPPKPDLWETIKNNPLYWMLGGIGLILLAKK